MTAGSALLIDGAGGLALGVARLAGAPRWAVATAQSAILRAWMSIYVGHMELYGRMTLSVQGDPFVPGESALVVCNHRSWTDTIVLYSLARQVGAHGDVKFFTKRSLLWFPVYGLAGVLCNVCLFIQRDMSAAAGAFLSLRTHLTGSDGDDVGGAVGATKLGGAAASRGGVGGGAAATAAAPKPGRFPPFWLINYLEGTRRTPAKVAQSQAFATSRGLPVLSHVLLPRTKGFIASAAALRGAATAVYDVTIGYGPLPGVSAAEAVGKGSGAVTPSFNSLLYTASTTPRVLGVYQRRIPMEEVPSDAAELTDWLYALYAAKDARLAHLAAHGTFEGPPVAWTRISWRRFVGCVALFWAAVAAVLWGVSAALRLLRGGGGGGLTCLAVQELGVAHRRSADEPAAGAQVSPAPPGGLRVGRRSFPFGALGHPSSLLFGSPAGPPRLYSLLASVSSSATFSPFLFLLPHSVFSLASFPG